MIKRTLSTVLLFLLAIDSFACPVCERNQPKILKGVTHGAGPQSNWDYIIIWITIVIVLITLFLSIKWLIRPGEHSKKHIKHVILNNE